MEATTFHNPATLLLPHFWTVMTLRQELSIQVFNPGQMQGMHKRNTESAQITPAGAVYV